MIDSKALQKIIVLHKGAGITVEGVIIDRGFCTNDVLVAIKESRDTLQSKKMILMLYGRRRSD